MFYDSLDIWSYKYKGAHVIVSRDGATRNYGDYSNNIETGDISKNRTQLQGTGTHSPERMYELALWCDMNCQGDWLIGAHVSGFELDEDFLAFKLRWM